MYDASSIKWPFGLPLLLTRFSWSSLYSGEALGVAFPWLEDSCRVLLRGLRGALVGRVAWRNGLNLRCIASRGGERGDLGIGDVDLDVTRRKAETLDGDRDSERRN